jgi:serine/threonine-protein kinase
VDDSHAPIRKPLDDALSGELQRIDRALARSWVVLSLISVVGSVVISLGVAPRVGVVTGVASVGVGAFFAVVLLRLSRGPLGSLGSIVVGAIEGLLPWGIFTVLVATQGAAYAIASWVPPLLFAASIVAATARLRPLAAIAIGASGGAAYLVVYFAYVRTHLPVGTARMVLHEPPLQLTRALSLAVAGGIGAYVSRELRGAIARADRSVRKSELFGKYRLVRQVASGGAGTVHEAVYCPEGGFERRVAVKLLHPHLAREESFVASFRTEADVGSRLAHPNIVSILDFGEQADQYFLAMEYVDGLSLQRFLQNAREARAEIPVGIAAYVVRALLVGLEYAHEGVRGPDGKALRVLHRDMCPANVLVSRFGEVKIADFGIARVLGDSASAHTRNVAGHAAYMAPEQAVAERIDVRADLFSVGVILWEMLALRRLFARSNPVATLHALVVGPVPSVTEVRPEIDLAWDAFITKALSREPNDRWASASEMCSALDGLPGARSARAMEELAALTERVRDARQRSEDPTIVERGNLA